MNANMLSVAADTFDYRNPLACSTYESIQMFHLCFDTLPKFFLESESSPLGKGIRHRFRIDTKRKWSNGTSITVAEICSSIQRVLSFSNPIRNFFFKDVCSLSVKGDIFAMELSCKTSAPLLAMELPALTPRKENLAHHYQICSALSEELLFKDCGISENRPEFIRILRVRDPLENFHLLRAGIIDVTCDTAFPIDLLAMLNEEVQVHDTGLYMIIRYGSRFNQDHELRHAVHRAILKSAQSPGP